MKKLSFISQIVLIGIFISCNGELGGNGGGDDEYAPTLFISFVTEGTNNDLFSSPSYSIDSIIQENANADEVFGPKFITPISKYNNKTTLLMSMRALAAGLGEYESGLIQNDNSFENHTRIFFKNGDIDTLYITSQCNESCWYTSKTMQIYFNGKLIYDFDFRDKDSELLERLLDNNYEPYGDTVVFEIPKVPEF